ncbi:MAG: hypothetical protein WBC51_27855 [Vicinamibacterales bacterium]
MVKAFIATRKQQRWLDLLAKPKRHSLLRVPALQSASMILEMLQQRGAPAQCYVVSESDRLDGRTLPLKEALGLIIGVSPGTLVSCIRGRLAYFEGEDSGARFILERGAA